MCKLMVIFLVVSFVTTVSAQEDWKPMNDKASFERQVDKVSKETITIQSGFSQEKNLSFLEEKIMTSGKFYFKAPNKLRWEYVDPFAYVIVLNGESVTIKDDDRVSKYDMESNKVFKEINDLMIELVQGKVLDNDKYEIGYFENSKNYMLDLKPKTEGMKAFLSSILITFEKDDYSVAEIKMIESSGDYTRIIFSGKTLNQPISDEVFVVN